MKKYIENDTSHTIYVGGRAIAPGEGREVEMPDDSAPQAPVEEAALDLDAPLHELLAGNVAAVTAALEGLSADTLLRLQMLENESTKPRKGVLEALGNAVIALADSNLKGKDLGADEEAALDLDAPLHELLAGNVAEVVAALEGLSVDTLLRLRALENESIKPRKGVLEALSNAVIALEEGNLNGQDMGVGENTHPAE